jgi:hypothetical protein
VASVARLALVAVVIIVVILLTRDCMPSRVVFPSPSPTVASASPTPTRSVPPSATGTATAIQQTTFTLTVSDAELTKAAASSFPQTVSGVTVRDPVVRTTTSGVRLTATATMFFGTTQFVMTGTPYVDAGRVAVRVDSVTLGGFGLGDSVRKSAADSVQSAIAQLVPSNVVVERVTLAEGSVMIEGTRR